jgi:hypothetical protein
MLNVDKIVEVINGVISKHLGNDASHFILVGAQIEGCHLLKVFLHSSVLQDAALRLLFFFI